MRWPWVRRSEHEREVARLDRVCRDAGMDATRLEVRVRIAEAGLLSLRASLGALQDRVVAQQPPQGSNRKRARREALKSGGAA